jgi:hypothetical protein
MGPADSLRLYRFLGYEVGERGPEDDDNAIG